MKRLAVRTIAIINQKGGCGKTTTAINLAAIFARRGLRTLLVDIDQQSHCAAGLGVPESRIEYSIGDAMLADHARDLDASRLLWEVARNLFLAPSTVRLAALEAPGGGLHTLPDKDRRLAGVLEKLASRFDRCLIDCPPTLGLLTFNALRAARECIIPVETSFFAFRGAEKQWATIQRLIERLGRPIACHILPTLHRTESRLSNEILEALQRQFAGQIVPVVIREHDILREATSFGQPLIEYAPESDAQRDFEALANWLEDHVPHLRPTVEVMAGDRGDVSAQLAVLPAGEAAAASAAPGAEAPMLRLRPFPRRGPPGTEPTAAATPPAGDAAMTSSRAAELVRRVRDLALRSTEQARELEGELSQALAPEAGILQSTIEAIGATGPPRIHDFAMPPAVLVSVSAPPRGHGAVTAPAAAAQPLPETALEASRPAPADEAPSRLAPIYGARQTTQGVLFVQPASAGQRVWVAGEFNAWSASATPLRLDRGLGVHQALVAIAPGTYQYRLVIDGRWQADPYNPRRQLNSYGEPNSVVVVDDRGAGSAA